VIGSDYKIGKKEYEIKTGKAKLSKRQREEEKIINNKYMLLNNRL
jgi:hypothetical protein